MAISAHRGGAEAAPAGSLAAYLDALSAGADFVEFDVQRTRDGQLIAYHDKHAELRGIHARNLTRRELHDAVGNEVLGLEDLLSVIAGRVKAHVDIKGSGFEADAVAQTVAAMGPDNMVVTGSDQVIGSVKQRFPEVRAALSLGRGRGIPLSQVVSTRWSELRPLQRIRACRADAVAVHYRLARLGVLGICARHGIGTMVWTVNDPAMIRSLVQDRRVDVLITERPRYALEWR